MEYLSAYFTQEQQKRIRRSHIGIAGAGGLGSNAAMMLARCGAGHLTIIDGDRVEPSNLNRQHYFPRHIGKPKVTALAEQLMELNPGLHLELRQIWLDASNIAGILPKADLWIEALDNAETKALFAAEALRQKKPLVCASGMGGFGETLMRRRVLNGVTVTGDFQSDITSRPPLAPRVIQCAAMEADAALEWILTGTIRPLQ